MNLKSCKVSFKAFKMKKQDLKCFIKIRNNSPLKRVFKRLSGLFAALFVNWRIDELVVSFFEVTNMLKF